MAVIIGHASIDENGNIQRGRAGDQNKKEVYTRNWYAHKQGWYVLRPKDSKVAEKIAKCMEDACANDNIGYDQTERNTLYNEIKDNGFKCDSKSLKTKVETDCSALVRVCLAYAGIKVSDFNTSVEKKVILATGQFVEVKENKTSDYLKRGDILVTQTKGHTLVVLSDGAKVSPTPSSTKEGEDNLKIDSAKHRDKTLTGTYITKDALNLRTGAGKTKSKIVTLPKDTEVMTYGFYNISNNVKWLLVEVTIDKVKYTGFVSSSYLEVTEKE